MRLLRPTVVRWTRPGSTTRRRPDTGPPPDAPITCWVYWIYVLDPRTNFTTLTLGYIGESLDPDRRFFEHLDEKPWADTVPERDLGAAKAAGTFFVSQNSYPCKADVVVAERAAIARDRPLYNYDGNLANPDRIPLYAQAQARELRDRANGVPAGQRWSDFEAVRAAARARRAPRPTWRVSTPRRLSPRARRRLVWAALWALVTLVLWTVVMLSGSPVSAVRSGMLCAGLTGIGLAWLHRPRRRGWQQSLNLSVRWMIVGAMLVVLIAPWLQNRP